MGTNGHLPSTLTAVRDWNFDNFKFAVSIITLLAESNKQKP